MGTDESLIGANGKSLKKKPQVSGTTTGVVETVKEVAETEKALARAMDSKRSEEERSAATARGALVRSGIQAPLIHGVSAS
jgi:hypothetical protein